MQLFDLVGNVRLEGLNAVQNGLSSITTHVNTAQKAIHAVGSGISNFGQAMLQNVTMPIVGLFKEAFDKSREFEQQLTNTGAVAGATAQEMETLSEQALKLGKDTKYSALEVAQGQEEMIKAGRNLNQVFDEMDDVLSLASAGGIEVAKSAEIGSMAVNMFNKEGVTFKEVADIMAGTANASATDVNLLASSFKYVGGIASDLNIPLADLSSVLGVLANNGVKGSSAGTGLRQMLTRLVPSSDKAVETFKRLNLMTADGANLFFDSTGKLKPLTEVVELLGQKLSGLTDAERMEAIKDMFGLVASPTVNALIKAGAKEIDNMANSIKKLTASEIASKKLKTMSGAIEYLSGSWETLLIQIGKINSPVIGKVVQVLNNIMTAILELPQPVKELGVSLLALTAIIAPLLIVLGGVVTGIGGLVAIATLFSPLTILIGLIAGLTSVVVGFLAIGGFAGFIAGFKYADFETIKTAFESIKKKAEEVKNWLVDIWSPAIDYILTGDKKSLAKIEDKDFVESLESIRKSLKLIGDKITEFVSDTDKSFSKIDKKKVEEFSKVVADFIDNVLKGTTGIFDFIDSIQTLIYELNRLRLQFLMVQMELPGVGSKREQMQLELKMYSDDIKHFSDQEHKLEMKIKVTTNIEEKKKLEDELKTVKEKQKESMELFERSENNYTKEFKIDANIIDFYAKEKITSSNTEIKNRVEEKIDPAPKQIQIDANVDPLKAFGEIYSKNNELQAEADRKLNDPTKDITMDGNVDNYLAYAKTFNANTQVQDEADKKLNDPTKNIKVDANVDTSKAKGALETAFEGIKSFASNYVFPTFKKVINFIFSTGADEKSLKLPGFASGVQNFGGGLAIVGERGAELVQLPKGSNVYTHSKTQSILGNSGAINKINNNNGETNTFYVNIEARSIKELTDVVKFFDNVKTEAITRRGY